MGVGRGLRSFSVLKLRIVKRGKIRNGEERPERSRRRMWKAQLGLKGRKRGRGKNKEGGSKGQKERGEERKHEIRTFSVRSVESLCRLLLSVGHWWRSPSTLMEKK